MTKKAFLLEISKLTSTLIEISISSEQNFPAEDNNSIYVSGDFDHGISLRNINYKDIYDNLVEQKNFNCKFLDGALIQMMYNFDNDENLIKHRLCYFPSPNLLAYDEYSEIYESDDIYADMIMKNVMPVPVRFDYESDENKFIEISHPYCHLTLGQHKNCRIPLSKPLTPYCFISFVIRNFYNNIYESFVSSYVDIPLNELDKCIVGDEENILHMNIK